MYVNTHSFVLKNRGKRVVFFVRVEKKFCTRTKTISIVMQIIFLRVQILSLLPCLRFFMTDIVR